MCVPSWRGPQAVPDSESTRAWVSGQQKVLKDPRETTKGPWHRRALAQAWDRVNAAGTSGTNRAHETEGRWRANNPWLRPVLVGGQHR